MDAGPNDASDVVIHSIRADAAARLNLSYERLPSNPVRLSAWPPSIQRLPPRLGADGEEILAELRRPHP
jgi:crotonobetainyl-CoA:carnitine CoA-transferase CaiB-like acyl-CoA transferase